MKNAVSEKTEDPNMTGAVSLEQYLEKRGSEPLIEPSRIFHIEIGQSEKWFGDNSRYPEKPTLKIETENGATLYSSAGAMSLCEGPGGGYDKIVVTDPMSFEQNIRNPFSHLGKFIKKYGPPSVGLEVQTGIDENGFKKIIL